MTRCRLPTSDCPLSPFFPIFTLTMEKVNVSQKLSRFADHWNPRVVGELNGQQVKLAKLLGEFVWHRHESEDELFYILKGQLDIEFRDHTVTLSESEFIIVPAGTEHRPVAREEVSVMLLEPASTINTGDNPGLLTRQLPETI
jgi:mannose-6-phosphate isomerase-like protein (cupin superfamily)